MILKITKELGTDKKKTINYQIILRESITEGIKTYSSIIQCVKRFSKFGGKNLLEGMSSTDEPLYGDRTKELYFLLFGTFVSLRQF